ncbi:MAG TPA: zinc-binding dehydrogenase, partial [Chloroflexota bacterium]
ASIRSLRHGGRIALVGNVRPELLQANPGLMIVKEIELIGSAHATPEDLRVAVSLVRIGRVTPRIAATFTIEQAAEAHRLLEARAVVGRAVLLVD